MTDKIQRFLLSTSLKDHVGELESLSDLAYIKNIAKEFSNKLVGLQKQEEDFNQSVHVAVESDEQQVKLNQ